MSLYYVGKVMNFLAQAVVQVEFPAYALSVHISYKIAKLDKQPLKSNFFAWHLFMHMLNMSALCM